LRKLLNKVERDQLEVQILCRKHSPLSEMPSDFWNSRRLC